MKSLARLAACKRSLPACVRSQAGRSPGTISLWTAYRRAAGYEGLSARDIWNRLDTEAQSVPGIFRHITAVMDSRRSYPRSI